jgi:hypothetical protein
VLSHFGNACLPGHGRTPKVYFLTRKGWELLSRESDIPAELLGSHREVKVDSRWSPQMYHRLRTVDLMISAEVAVKAVRGSPWWPPFSSTAGSSGGHGWSGKQPITSPRSKPLTPASFRMLLLFSKTLKVENARSFSWKWIWGRRGSCPRSTRRLPHFSKPVCPLMPFSSRFEHTHIVAGSGHGKTPLLQQMIPKDLTKLVEGKDRLL